MRIDMFKKRTYILKEKNYPNVKFAVISDLHNKKIENNCKIFDILREIKPDFIIFAGDMISRKTTDFSNLEIVCKKASEIAKVYAAPGNHELSIYLRGLEIYRKILKKYNVSYLENETVSTDENFHITGLVLKYDIYKDENDSYKNLKDYTIKQLKTDAGDLKKGFNLVIAHNPNCFETYCKWGADVVVSGHVHGGIIRLPFVGGLLSPERKFFPKYSLGEYKKEKTHMIVSAGIGKFRLFNPSEIVEIILEKS